MENPGVLISWMYEAATNTSAFLSDPKNWGPIFAVIALMVFYSIVSSIKRLNGRVAAAFSELSAIKSSLKKIELSLGRIEAKRSLGDRDEKDIRDLLFQVGNDKME